MKLFLRYLCIFLFVASITACNKFSKTLKSKDTDYQLVQADDYFVKGKYRSAQQLYETLFPVFKGSQKFEDLYYRYAYCFYYQKLYSDAENLFKGFLETFPNSTKAEEIDFMRSFSFYKQSPKLELEQVNTIKAMNMMQSFINTHPGSKRIAEATEIIDKSRQKLEQKDARAALLYYNLGQFRAAAIAHADLGNNYPESALGDQYKLMVVKSYFRFAKLSYSNRQEERYNKVINEFEDFSDRFPESKLLKEAESYSNLSKINIKALQNEQITSSAKR